MHERQKLKVGGNDLAIARSAASQHRAGFPIDAPRPLTLQGLFLITMKPGVQKK
jgi:hypothetical protein